MVLSPSELADPFGPAFPGDTSADPHHVRYEVNGSGSEELRLDLVPQDPKSRVQDSVGSRGDAP